MSDNQFAMASEWMGNGNINGFVRAHGGVNRFELVGIHIPLFTSCLVGNL